MKPNPLIHKLIFSRRKTLVIQITLTGEVVVRAPHRMSQAAIHAFVLQKEDWILEKLALVKTKQAKAKQNYKKFQAGENFLYLGKEYPLKLIDQYQDILSWSDQTFLLGREFQPSALAHFTSWYQQEAKKILATWVEHYAQRYDLHPRGFKISHAKKRWGSCNQKGTLHFSWRLIMAPESVVHYVIVHELSHLKHFNHSKHFWQTVKAILPDYQQPRHWLKQHGHLLSIA